MFDSAGLPGVDFQRYRACVTEAKNAKGHEEQDKGGLSQISPKDPERVCPELITSN